MYKHDKQNQFKSELQHSFFFIPKSETTTTTTTTT